MCARRLRRDPVRDGSRMPRIRVPPRVPLSRRVMAVIALLAFVGRRSRRPARDQAPRGPQALRDDSADTRILIPVRVWPTPRKDDVKPGRFRRIGPIWARSSRSQVDWAFHYNAHAVNLVVKDVAMSLSMTNAIQVVLAAELPEGRSDVALNSVVSMAESADLKPDEYRSPQSRSGHLQRGPGHVPILSRTPRPSDRRR